MTWGQNNPLYFNPNTVYFTLKTKINNEICIPRLLFFQNYIDFWMVNAIKDKKNYINK